MQSSIRFKIYIVWLSHCPGGQPLTGSIIKSTASYHTVGQVFIRNVSILWVNDGVEGGVRVFSESQS
jgi:hypothetical protein